MAHPDQTSTLDGSHRSALAPSLKGQARRDRPIPQATRNSCQEQLADFPGTGFRAPNQLISRWNRIIKQTDQRIPPPKGQAQETRFLFDRPVSLSLELLNFRISKGNLIIR
jgi:hypothetical protein